MFQFSILLSSMTPEASTLRPNMCLFQLGAVTFFGSLAMPSGIKGTGSPTKDPFTIKYEVQEDNKRDLGSRHGLRAPEDNESPTSSTTTPFVDRSVNDNLKYSPTKAFKFRLKRTVESIFGEKGDRDDTSNWCLVFLLKRSNFFSSMVAPTCVLGRALTRDAWHQKGLRVSKEHAEPKIVLDQAIV
ncbi:hypothetical protein TNIN_245801 [Trichonephila inaurata madagascariensis]|uniref:Uncharacterized protein n=1 Tax=Trichonephila inaurata madagascariensis TaxID=2747483 RepID=A0A8X7C5D1_9ARAC|nr:hypothetical protein TNIN_245801 [Trichonephila inaurata madagascariensis]